jgi:phosphoserine aminotransferase
MTRAHNFSAGPAALPLAVLERARDELLDYRGSGMSIMEQSHRGALYEEVHNTAIANLRELLGIPDGYHVLFMQGGARGQFAMVPMNLLLPPTTAWYVDTGNWSRFALAEARRRGSAEACWSSADSGYDHVPTTVEVPPDAAYLHSTSNNTVVGSQIRSALDCGDVPHVCDMSSDILSEPIDVSRYGLIYAGAQKNMGPSGVTLVIVRDDLLTRSIDSLPETMHYGKVAAKNSMLNTPPTFAIYLMGLVLDHLKGLGGLAAVATTNAHKAELLYREIDSSAGFYTGCVQPAARSRMNVTFRSPSPELDRRFVAEAADAGLVGLEGHRSVGGLRASIYNAVPLASVRVLVEFLEEFKRTHG